MKTPNIRGAVEKMNTTLVGKQVFLNLFPKKGKQQVRIIKPTSLKGEAKTASKFAV
jgi:hypothetical protein